jgi:hypothetical protein
LRLEPLYRIRFTYPEGWAAFLFLVAALGAILAAVIIYGVLD